MLNYYTGFAVGIGASLLIGRSFFHKQKLKKNGRILDGKKMAATIRQEVKQQIEQRKQDQTPTPELDVIIVGDDPASKIYVNIKQRACKSVGITSNCHLLPEATTKQELVSKIQQLNKRKKTTGILLQQPLPAHLNPDDFSEVILPEKDVDGFHPYNFGRLGLRYPMLRPCTSRGVMTLIESTKTDIAGKKAVVIGCSNLVGRPMVLELMLARCTVTTCNSLTSNLKEHIRSADIVIAAIGRPNVIKSHWIKPGSIVIDIGINKLKDGTIVGDINFDKTQKRASWITPVPGGVGPMTVATLLQNTVQAAELRDATIA